MLSGAAVSGGGLSERQKLIRRIKSRLVGMGYFEAVNFSFCSPGDLELFGMPESAAVKISNPLNENYSVMRPLILPQMVKTVADNYKQYGSRDGKLFEFGRVFTEKPVKGVTEILEKESLALAVYGKRYSFFDLKGAIEALYGEFGLKASFEAASVPFFNPGISAKILLNGRETGFIGQLSYELADACELGSSNDTDVIAVVAELDADSLIGRGFETGKYKVPPEPKIRRDFSFTVPQSLSYADVIKVLSAAELDGGVSLAEVSCIEKYTGDKVDSGFYGLTIRIIFEPSVARYDPKKLSYNAVSQAALDFSIDSILKSLNLSGVNLRGL
jgi:phenylalanyl-tRNA synthetase beta subunit